MSEQSERFDESELPAVEIGALFGEQYQLQNDPGLNEAASSLLAALESEMLTEEQLHELWIEYAKNEERVVDSMQEVQESPQSRAKAHVAVIIHKALLFKQAGNVLRYLEELDAAEVYAFNEGLDEISTVLFDEIMARVGQLEPSPEVMILKLKDVIDEDKREILKDSLRKGVGLEELIARAHRMAAEEGVDFSFTLE